MAVKNYTTLQGDAWDAIAYRLWGHESLFVRLMDANPQYLDVVTFPPGINLLVPEIDAPVSEMEMPPWMQ